MSNYDPITGRYSDPTPPCPFCGAPPRVPAITPASDTECSRCRLRVPAGRWHRVALALADDTAERLLAVRHERDAALRALREAQDLAQHLAADLEASVAELERSRT